MIAGLGLAGAQAQGINIDAGKTPAQIFASDCSVCHKGPRGLAKNRNARSVAEFLRQHYTSSRDQAATMAGYLLGAGSDPRAATARPTAATGRSPGQAPAAERAGQTAEDQDAESDSRTRRGRRAAQPPRTPEGGILAEEPPRPPRGVPERPGRQSATGASNDAPESRSATQGRSRRAPASAAAQKPSEEALAGAASAATADAPPASATTIESILSGTTPAASEPNASPPVPPRSDDIPD
jgi:hypothetical protein